MRWVTGGTGSCFATLPADVADRTVAVVQPDGSSNVSLYSANSGGGSRIEFIDALGNRRFEERNALGELAASTDAGGLRVDYDYDATGNLLAARRDAGAGEIVSRMEYDALGRKAAQFDPDAGTWRYTYNALGEQVAQTDDAADPIQIEQWRDARGRVFRHRSGRASALEVEHTYSFDSASPGQLSEERSLGGYGGVGGVQVDFRRTFNYDSLGRVIGSSTVLDGISYHALTEYDALGRAWRSQDPTGAWLKTEFDARGYALRLCESSAGDSASTCAGGAGTWLETLLTDARGNVLRERRGGSTALEILRQYDDATGRLLGLCAGINCRLQDEQYEWDRAGNLLARDKAEQYREVFIYDALNRLTQSRYTRVGQIEYGLSDGPVSSAQTYDKLGNICSKLIYGEAQGYRYGGLAGCGLGSLPGSHDGDSGQSPHAVLGTDRASFAYDAHGNQTSADYTGSDDAPAPRTIAYTVADQAWQIVQDWDQFTPQNRTRFWYGPDGSRYQRIDEAAGVASKRTLYVGNLEIVSQGGVSTTRRYVAGVAVEEWQGSARTPRFILHDHLGSVVALIDANAQLVEAMDFGAFGERRGNVVTGADPVASRFTARGFTGHEMVDGTDIVHMNGRIYDHRLGRFLQADPFVQEPNNPQNFNRYSYVLNNPLSLTDPSGFLFGGVGKFFKNYFRPLAAIAISIYFPPALSATLGELGAAVAAGFVSGVVSSGSLKGGIFGAFSAAAFFGVGSAIERFGKPGDFVGSGLSRGTFGAKVLSHGITGGVMAELQGGKFGHGFAAAGVAAGFSGQIDGLDPETVGISVERVFVAAALGGTTSELTGGKFANGAITGAFSRAFNDEAHQPSQEEQDDVLKVSLTIRKILQLELSSEGEFAAGITTSTPFDVSLKTNGTVTISQGANVFTINDIKDFVGSGLKSGPFSVTAVVGADESISFVGKVTVLKLLKIGDLSISYSKKIDIRSGVLSNSGLLGRAAGATDPEARMRQIDCTVDPDMDGC